ncbi:MAG: ComEC/Rec2 family competence protein [Minisyncoccia bacterium]|jgi:ComEC/Rec2-related protein
MRTSIGTKMKIGDVSFGTAAAFLFGIFAANMRWNIFLLAATGIVMGGMGLLLFPRRRGSWKYFALFFCAAGAGVLYYHAYAQWQTAHTHMPTGKSPAFFGIVAEAPKAAGNYTMLMVSLLRPYADTVDIFTFPDSSQFHYGDELWISGAVTANVGDEDEPPAMFLPQLRVVGQHQGFWLKEMVINIEQSIVQRIAQALPADQAALLSGILLGTSGTLGAVLKAQMETSGTSYIVNMYGYKIIIITFALTAALKNRMPRRVLLWITLGAIALFVFISGGTISAVRAAIMGSLAVVARGTGRVFSARNAIAFAAVGMAIANATVLTDAAFQLSFLSFIGIYYLGPPIEHYFHWTDEGALQWRSHAMLSLSTNLAILPIVMNTFGDFSLTSFISNILIMIPWLAVIIFGVALAIFSYVAPPLAFCAAQITSVLLQYELFIIHFFATVTLPMPAVFGSAFAIALYYGVLILFAHYYAAPSSQKNY